jgi:hypothetical protein
MPAEPLASLALGPHKRISIAPSRHFAAVTQQGSK